MDAGPPAQLERRVPTVLSSALWAAAEAGDAAAVEGLLDRDGYASPDTRSTFQVRFGALSFWVWAAAAPRGRACDRWASASGRWPGGKKGSKAAWHSTHCFLRCTACQHCDASRCLGQGAGRGNWQMQPAICALEPVPSLLPCPHGNAVDPAARGCQARPCGAGGSTDSTGGRCECSRLWRHAAYAPALGEQGRRAGQERLLVPAPSNRPQ